MNRIITLMLILLFFTSSLFAKMYEMRWGGSGFETDNKFIARIDPYNKSTILIIVDSKKTIDEVGSMYLFLSNKQELSSIECWKYERHITAPWACSFQCGNIKQLYGEGKIVVKDRSDQILIEENLDLNELGAICNQSLKSEIE